MASEMQHKKNTLLGFPGGSVDKKPPASEGDTGLIPGPGRSQVAMEQLSLCTTTIEPVLHNKRNHCNEKPAHCREE